LYAVFGLGTPGLRGLMQVKDRALLLCAGLLAQGQRSLVGLERVLEEYFRVGVSGRQLVGRWLTLDEDQWTVLGRGGRNARLGEGAVLGKRVWDQQGAFELVLGPLSLEEFLEFLPTGWGFRPLCDLVRFYCGDGMDFRVRLQLKRFEVAGARLSAKGGARLGWTSWLKRADWAAEAAEARKVAGTFCDLLGSEVVVSLASLGAFPAEVRIPHFGLPPDKLEELLACTTPQHFGAGRCVVRQGAQGTSMFIIRSGSVRITRNESDGTETYLATLGARDYFGEMSLVTGKARNATAVTLSDCELLELQKEDFDEFRRRYPRFDAALRAYVEGRKQAGE
ncbi:MAG TPA: type VI secretion system baseplate subunit TssG, partial [Pyrinomonadaceae bacterium]